jgi:hypothetical protein
MAEPHDLAEHSVKEASGAGLPASFPPGPPEVAAPAEQTYRSLSLLALIGFSAAGVYVASVVLLGLFALGAGKPLSLGAWGWFALLAVALCGVAWLRVYRSEDTLAGGALARWGLLLAGFVGLGYGAYALAINLALRQQTEQFAREWLDLIRAGRLEQALFRTLPPIKRAGISEDSQELLEKFALANDSAAEIPPAAMLQRFARMDLVRRVAQGGSDTVVTFRGMQWDHTQGGYDVRLSVHIETPECSFDAVITVHGTQAPHGEFAGRQWRVVIERHGTGVDKEAGGVQLKPFGEKVERVAAAAYQFLSQWQQQLGRSTKEEAFLLTLPEDERPRGRQALHRALAGAVLAGGGATPDSDILAGYNRFLSGGLVEVPSPGFASTEDLRKEAVGAVGAMFAERTTRAPLVPLPQQERPFWMWTQKGNKLQFTFVLTLADRPDSRVEVAFRLEGDARALEGDAPPRWRMAGIKLISAANRPPMRPRQGGPNAVPGG